ncbi:hypothetical protein GCM10010409_38050 [Mycolicibacterium diernhoferi]
MLDKNTNTPMATKTTATFAVRDRYGMNRGTDNVRIPILPNPNAMPIIPGDRSVLGNIYHANAVLSGRFGEVPSFLRQSTQPCGYRASSSLISLFWATIR